jgi:catechol 2,3-dioxygenase-like lactoylglutathione lyase family enzyme
MKKRTGTPWMPADDFGRSIPAGIGLNLLVPDVEPMVTFCRDVLGGAIVYADADFAVVHLLGSILMVHADHTYLDHPMTGVVAGVEPRGIGAEIRLYGAHPDAVEARARELGFDVLAGSLDKPHGIRECHVVGPAGYIFVPSRSIPG